MFVRRSPASELVRPSIRSAIRAGRRLGWRLSWICVALLSLSAGTPGQVADHGVSEAAPRRSQEPITPIPQPPAADPGKLALGERLFMDQRLSHDGTLSCMSCHDVRTNGADRGGHNATTAPPFNPLAPSTALGRICHRCYIIFDSDRFNRAGLGYLVVRTPSRGI
jgi:hypothetical protein